MSVKFRFYLFDVDGTLVDSEEDIYSAFVDVMNTLRVEPPPRELVRNYIGRQFRELFRYLFPEATEADLDHFVELYRQAYRKRDHRATRLFPGVREALSRLGGKKSTVTTKSARSTRVVLERFGLLEFFDHIQGVDGLPGKPAPDMVFHAMEALGADPSDCLLVGDSTADMEAGRRAGVRICAVTYGYGDKQALAHWEPDLWVSDLRELLG